MPFGSRALTLMTRGGRRCSTQREFRRWTLWTLIQVDYNRTACSLSILHPQRKAGRRADEGRLVPGGKGECAFCCGRRHGQRTHSCRRWSTRQARRSSPQAWGSCTHQQEGYTDFQGERGAIGSKSLEFMLANKNAVHCAVRFRHRLPAPYVLITLALKSAASSSRARLIERGGSGERLCV